MEKFADDLTEEQIHYIQTLIDNGQATDNKENQKATHLLLRDKDKKITGVERIKFSKWI